MKKELRKNVERTNKMFTQQAQISYCPVCGRGYLLEDEKELIKEKGKCYACQWFADNTELRIIDGKYCSRCNSELDVDYDGEFDPQEGFVSWAIAWCPTCLSHIKYNEEITNQEGEKLPF